MFQAVDGVRSVLEIGRLRGSANSTRQANVRVGSEQACGDSSAQALRWSGCPCRVGQRCVRRVFEAVDASGSGGQVRDGLASFAVGAGVYDILFRGAGPNEKGELDADRVAANSLIIAGGADPMNLLKQILHEYVGFALFCAGNALETTREERLKKDVTNVLAQLRPVG